MQLRYVVCAEQILLDSNTNRVTAINILDHVVSKKFPITLPRLSFILAVHRQNQDAPEVNCRADLLLNGEKLLEGPLNVSFEGSNKARAIGVAENFVLREPGTLKIAVFANDEEFASWSFDVDLEE